MPETIVSTTERLWPTPAWATPLERVLFRMEGARPIPASEGAVGRHAASAEIDPGRHVGRHRVGDEPRTRVLILTDGTAQLVRYNPAVAA